MAVNPFGVHDTSERSKLLQLVVAKDCGFRVPETLVSNDPIKIRNFVAKGVNVIGKALGTAVWPQDNGPNLLAATTFVHEGLLPDDNALRSAPCILQEAVPKFYEVRANVMGDHVLAGRLDVEDMNGDGIDWRTRPDLLHISPIDLPNDVNDKLIAVTKRLGLNFGAVDLIVDPDGNHYFLEINQMGQFLWIEEQCSDIPILDTFCQFLISADSSFKPFQSRKVSYDEICQEAKALAVSEGDRISELASSYSG